MSSLHSLRKNMKIDNVLLLIGGVGIIWPKLIFMGKNSGSAGRIFTVTYETLHKTQNYKPELKQREGDVWNLERVAR